MAGFYSIGSSSSSGLAGVNTNYSLPEIENPDRRQNRVKSGINSESWFIYGAEDVRGLEICTDHEPFGAGVSMEESDERRSGFTMNCRDCGNQAKKDCSHIRCRTCCNNRGLPCETHVRSTWVPAAKRRELRHHQQQQDQRPPPPPLSLDTSRDNYKRRQRENNPGALKGHFPATVNSPAVFQMVRLSSVDESDDQISYQTWVSIGGHIFKGILYDQGPETQPISGDSSSSTLNLISPHNNSSATAEADNTAVNIVSPSTTISYDPSIYPMAGPFDTFMSGAEFFPHSTR